MNGTVVAKIAKIAICVFIIGIFMSLFSTDGYEKQVEKEMSKIEYQVANDAVRQYELAKKHGDPIDVYVHAGLVAAAYLQAEDEENYKKWKNIERQEAKNAGMPNF